MSLRKTGQVGEYLQYYKEHKEVFQNFISNEAKYINHCSINYNTDVTSKDHKIYKLIANQNINKGDELTTNYDNINKKFPFISSSKEGYKTC